jgi:uncharacterized protein YgiM (DUF1202 family)
MKKFAATLVVLCVFVGVGSSVAQTATVTRNVNLRPDPSTDNDPIEKLKPPVQVQLVEQDPTDGYYHVTAPDGQDGWVWGKNISIRQDVTTNQPTPTPTPSATGTPTSGADLYSLLVSVRKTAVGQPLVENQQEVCGPEGDATNPNIQALNDNKNRTDQPSSYVAVSWDQLKNLPSDRVNDFQGAPVSVVGYLSHKINVEKGESTNCHLLAPTEVDWHIYLTNSPTQGIADAVIVETTPRVRPMHKMQ